jgi:hypothetical protein
VNTSIAGRAVVVGDRCDVVTPVDRNGVAPSGSEIVPAFGDRRDDRPVALPDRRSDRRDDVPLSTSARRPL